MAISIDWNTKIIFVPQSFLTSLGGGLYELDTNTFRLALKDIEDDDGMPFLDTHRHNTVVNLGGIGYARTIEIINGYTVTFEDGQYAVNLVGSNNNIADVTNINQVSIRPSNSAGLIQTREIQYASFENAVTINLATGVAGTAYPIGTARQPVNNVADALAIAVLYGFQRLHVEGNITFDTGDDISGYTVAGQNALQTHITLLPGAVADGTEFTDVSITGYLDDGAIIRNSYAYDLNFVNGFIFQTQLAGTMMLGGASPSNLMSCYSATDGVEIDFDGAHDLNIADFNGDILLANKTGPADATVHVGTGGVTLDASVTNGVGLHLAGVGDFTNNSLVEPDQQQILSQHVIADAVWDEPLADHSSVGTVGKRLKDLLPTLWGIK